MKIGKSPQKSAKHRLFQRSCSILVTTWLLLLLQTPVALAQPELKLVELTVPELAVTFAHPDIFEISPEPNALRAVLLRSKESGTLPSISVLAVPGRYDFDRPPKRQAQDLVHSYKLVGFTDARCRKLTIGKTHGTAVAQAEMTYSQAERVYTSRVAIFSGGHRHFLITLSDHAESYQNSKELLNPIIDSFQSKDLIKIEASTHKAWLHTEGLLGLLLSAGLLLIFLLFRALLSRTKRRGATRPQTKPSERG
ncbi:MAG: hypothetical protein GX589_04840 [Deltaproteobacteria bacterium]|nr:hypothetical protein [Deltaproteobacteria bacterium]